MTAELASTAMEGRLPEADSVTGWCIQYHHLPWVTYALVGDIGDAALAGDGKRRFARIRVRSGKRKCGAGWRSVKNSFSWKRNKVSPAFLEHDPTIQMRNFSIWSLLNEACAKQYTIKMFQDVQGRLGQKTGNA